MLFQEKNQEMEIIRIHFSSWVQTIIVISPKSLSSHLMSFHSKCFVLLFIKRNFKNMLAKQNRWISRHISLPWFKEKKGKKRKKLMDFSCLYETSYLLKWHIEPFPRWALSSFSIFSLLSVFQCTLYFFISMILYPFCFLSPECLSPLSLLRNSGFFQTALLCYFFCIVFLKFLPSR